jgi:uncharacterized protein YigE (DUF2233 family)
VYASAVDGTALAAVSGGFYGLADSSNFIPVGLVVAGGRRISRLSRSNIGGVLLCEPGGGLRVVPIRAFKASPAVRCALQSKPLLVHDGEVDVRGDGPRMNRSAVAVTERGTVVLAGAFESFGEALSLREFAGFLVHLRRSAQVPIAAALNMDGGPGAHLYFPPLKLHYGDPGANFIPNVVHLTRTTAVVAPVR